MLLPPPLLCCAAVINGGSDRDAAARDGSEITLNHLKKYEMQRYSRSDGLFEGTIQSSDDPVWLTKRCQHYCNNYPGRLAVSSPAGVHLLVQKEHVQ